MSQRTPLSPEELSKKIQEITPLPSVFDLVGVHVVITDENANILYMNKAAEKQTGFSREESIGKTPGDLWGGNEDEEVYKKLWMDIKTNKTTFAAKMKNKRKDGTEMYQQLSITPVLDDAGNIKYFIAIEPDVTTEQMKTDNLQIQVNLLFQSAVDRELTMTQLKKELAALPAK